MLSGLFTRAVSVAMIPILLGALLVHLPNGWLFSSPNGGWEFPAFGSSCSPCRLCSAPAPSR